MSNLKTVIDEIKCIYTQLDTSNKEDVISSLISIRDNLIARHDVISKKAQLAKEQLQHYKCILVDDTYIIVPIIDEGHRFGTFSFNQDVIYYNHPLPNRGALFIKLWEVPYGPSELLAWCAAYNKFIQRD